jgi:hypothetical protein
MVLEEHGEVVCGGVRSSGAIYVYVAVVVYGAWCLKLLA